jgi:hypothetical protein
VIPDRDVWQAAVLMVRRYKEDATLEASERADQLLSEGDMAGAEDVAPDPERDRAVAGEGIGGGGEGALRLGASHDKLSTHAHLPGGALSWLSPELA